MMISSYLQCSVPELQNTVFTLNSSVSSVRDRVSLSMFHFLSRFHWSKENRSNHIYQMHLWRPGGWLK